MIKATTDPKVNANHLRRQAIVYIRQSSAHQIRSNRESSQRQYALVNGLMLLVGRRSRPRRLTKTKDALARRRHTDKVSRNYLQKWRGPGGRRVSFGGISVGTFQCRLASIGRNLCGNANPAC